MLEFIAAHWMSGLWTILLGILTTLIGKVSKRLATVVDKYEAVEDGVLSILHDRLQQVCVCHLKVGYISVDDLENLETMFKSYTRLGGNGTVKKLYERCQELRIVENKESED